LSTAYALFSRRGIQAVGVDEVIARAGVAKATLYRHFTSKDELVLAFRQRREQLWTIQLVERQSELRGGTPEERLLAIFDVFHDWFARRREHPLPGQHPDDRARAGRTGRARRPRKLRLLVAHPDEGGHRLRRRRRPRGRTPGPGNGRQLIERHRAAG
jgi:AcrR family transcriptional regulator